MSELKRRSGISDVTLSSIRNGYSARRSTINKLLRTFSEIYGVKLTIRNVDGIIIQGKPVSASPVTGQVSISPTSNGNSKATIVQNNPEVSEDMPNDLPPGTAKLTNFVETHNLKISNVGRWVNKGLEGEKLKTVTRIGRNGRIQHFLTPELQQQARDFLRRHGKLKTLEVEEKAAEEPLWYLPDKE